MPARCATAFNRQRLAPLLFRSHSLVLAYTNRFHFCHESAALLWGLPMPYASLSRTHIATTPRDRRSSRGGIVRHCISNDDVVVIDGILVTSLVRTAFDCLRKRPFDHGLPIADRAAALSDLSPTQLQQRFRKTGSILKRSLTSSCAMASREAPRLSRPFASSLPKTLQARFATPMFT